jgi:hypothetical protein
MKQFLVFAIFVFALLLLANCQGEKKQPALTDAEKTAYLAKGKTIAEATFAELSGRLAHALETGGVPHAVQYCNTVALPLTDSLSKVHNAVIRRTSKKTRNPKNQPSEWESKILDEYEIKAKSGEVLTPVVLSLEAKAVAFAAPIKVLPLCLKCHGKPGETMFAEDAELVKQLYPQDLATGYAEGELRGMWSIVFQR